MGEAFYEQRKKALAEIQQLQEQGHCEHEIIRIIEHKYGFGTRMIKQAMRRNEEYINEQNKNQTQSPTGTSTGREE